MANGALAPASSSALVPLTLMAGLLQGSALASLQRVEREAGMNPNAFCISDLLLLLNPGHCLECLLQRGMKWMFI